MNYLQKLHKIEAQKVIYNIHYCSAGVGFIFCDPKLDTKQGEKSYEKALVVENYYPTIEDAIDAEYARL